MYYFYNSPTRCRFVLCGVTLLVLFKFLCIIRMIVTTTLLIKRFLAANASPKINVQSSMNITVGQQESLNVTVSDADGDFVTLAMETVLPPGASFDNQTGIFSWLPNNPDAVNISYVHVHTPMLFT